MRSLQELDISTAMTNNLQAGMAQPPVAEGGEGTAAFPKMFMPRE
jgi:hypothetical protein